MSSSDAVPSEPGSTSLGAIFRKSKRPENFWFTIYYALSSFIVLIALRARWKPNQITFAGFGGNALAALAFVLLAPHPAAPFVAFALFTAAHVLDCADGHLAFVGDMRSEAGAWLDASLDVVKLSLATWCLLTTASLHAAQLPARALWVAQLAALGPIVNYGVSLCANKYKIHVDQYAEYQLAARISGNSFKAKLLRLTISHLREYGNYLLLIPLVAMTPRVGIALVGLYGAGNYALALNRVRSIRKAIIERT